MGHHSGVCFPPPLALIRSVPVLSRTSTGSVYGLGTCVYACSLLVVFLLPECVMRGIALTSCSLDPVCRRCSQRVARVRGGRGDDAPPLSVCRLDERGGRGGS